MFLSLKLRDIPLKWYEVIFALGALVSIYLLISKSVEKKKGKEEFNTPTAEQTKEMFEKEAREILDIVLFVDKRMIGALVPYLPPKPKRKF